MKSQWQTLALLSVLFLGLAFWIWVLDPGRQLQDFWQTSDKLTVPGTLTSVVEAKLKHAGTYPKGAWVETWPAVTYDYTFNGKKHTGSRVTMGHDRGGDFQTLHELWKAGKPIKVYVVPDNPSRSFLYREFDFTKSDIGYLIVSVPLVVLSVILGFGARSSYRDEREHPNLYRKEGDPSAYLSPTPNWLDRLLRRETDPTIGWEQRLHRIPRPEINLEAASFGGLHLGDDVREASIFGKPEKVQWSPGGNFTLSYLDQRSYDLEFKKRSLSEVFIVFDPESRGSQEALPAVLGFGPKPVPLHNRMSLNQARSYFGDPDEMKNDDYDVSLTYRRGEAVLELEFDEGGEHLEYCTLSRAQ